MLTKDDVCPLIGHSGRSAIQAPADVSRRGQRPLYSDSGRSGSAMLKGSKRLEEAGVLDVEVSSVLRRRAPCPGGKICGGTRVVLSALKPRRADPGTVATDRHGNAGRRTGACSPHAFRGEEA